ncbi:MAG: carbohydrate-binding domain-containing protein [Oscillospiraceae bacterium]|nr:carbohydrate-binding domain-containing protein [Oscillospiraceae bacterium]
MKNADKRAGVLTVAIAAMTLAIGAQAMASSAATAGLLGDANADAAFGVADAVLFSKFLGNGNVLSAQGAANSDMNGDTVLNAIDLTLMKRQLLTPSVPVNPDGDNVVTAITYEESSVTLKNASGAVVSAADATNVTVANNTMVTITVPGEYDVSGTCTNGQLKINCDKTTYALGQVTCNLLGLNLSNSSDSPIYVASIDDECVLTVKNGYTNTIADGTSYTNEDAGVGAIYSCDDMKIKGQGTLIVKGNCEDGIVCKNDLKIWNGDIQVTAVDDGIRGKDSVRIGDPDDLDYTALNINITTTTGDGIKSTDEADTTHGFVRVTGGTVTVNSCGDAISGVYSVEINGGSLNLSTTGNTVSAKGLKAGYTDDTTGTEYTGNVTVNGGYIYAKTNDDCINANGDVNILGGQLELQTIQTTTGNQAIHADTSCYLGTDGGAYSDFELVVYNAYEGIEAFNIYQKSGATIVTSVDDAFNVAGGADNSGSSGMWPGQGGMGGSGGVLEISGGFSIVSVTNGDHDGYDSNGSITISGGICISNGQEPFDSDGGITYTGGVYIKNAGSSGMGGGPGGMGGSSMTETVNVSASVAAGTRVTLCDASGNVIVSFINDKATSSLIAGCTAYNGASFYTGGTLNGSTYFQEMDDTQLAAYGGTLSGGTAVTGSGTTNPWG